MQYYLAPMEGITGYVFRNVYHQYFPAMDKYFTPFLSPNADGKLSPREYQDVAPEHNEGMKVVPQILTNCAKDFIRTANTLKRMGYDEVNLNLGCPSGTVVSKGKGSGFLAFPEKLNQCLYEIFSQLDMKISIKTRAGKERPEEFEQLLEIYNQYKMEELIIHPRVQKDGYKNTPSLPAFAYAYMKSTNPLCYNGDIFQVKDGEKIMEKFPGLPAMMLGRGIVANPELLLELNGDKGGAEENRREVGGAEGNGKEDGGAKGEKRKARKRLRKFHDSLYEAYAKVYLHVSGPKVVLFKMKEIWCYLAFSFDCESVIGKAAGNDSGPVAENTARNKALKQIKKAQNLREYETAVALMFTEE